MSTFEIVKKLNINWDGLGIATSIICAVHCVVLPLLLTSMTLFGVNIIHNIFFEWGMILFAFLIGLQSLMHSYKKHHKKYTPIWLFSIGITLLATKQFFTFSEYIFVLPAVVCIIYAHTLNYILSKKTKCTSPYHAH